jgi:hypothetical protein
MKAMVAWKARAVGGSERTKPIWLEVIVRERFAGWLAALNPGWSADLQNEPGVLRSFWGD